MDKVITLDELAKHNSPGDLWVAIAGDVYNVSTFAGMHPGGEKLIEQYAGIDASDDFFSLHRKEVLLKYQRLKVGRLSGAEQSITGEEVPVPFADPPAFTGMMSPYYSDSHRRLQKDVRRLVNEYLVPEAAAGDLAGRGADKELKKKIAMEGLLVCRLGPGPWLKEAKALGVRIPGDVDCDEFDYFHLMIIHQEFARLGTPGWTDGCGGGYLISCPCIQHFGSEAMKRTLGRELLLGDKQSCLAISEPFAGSDVAAVRTTAVKTPDGRFYIVNGVKKWITEGMTADIFVTAVRTGGPGAKGISLLVIERGEGVETNLIKTTYSTAAGTSLVIFNDVKVPVENLLGKENGGFRLIMYNFNLERWMIVNNLVGLARAALGDALKWAKQRKVFGKELIGQPVIRYKLANSAAALESVYTYMEAITYDMCKAKDGTLSTRMGGQIAMLKYHATRTCWQIADDTVQILGGRGITKTGMGAKVENFKNFAKYAAVYGGSEEIMADLAIKTALKTIPDSLSAKL
jgi:alkylation response protein AidB-like acyl-CoA dehydrogenase/predicted heme/steroid binding protein